jgi:hypothetical protein
MIGGSLRLETTLDKVSTGRPGKRGKPSKNPDRSIIERPYDFNPLRKRLAKRGIEPIVPTRRNNKKGTYQDGRKLRRYRKREMDRGADKCMATELSSPCRPL